MPIISVSENENNRWKKNPQKQNKTSKQTKTEKKKGADAIVKGWELNDLIVYLR